MKNFNINQIKEDVFVVTDLDNPDVTKIVRKPEKGETIEIIPGLVFTTEKKEK